MEDYAALFGLNDKNIDVLEQTLDVSVSMHNHELVIQGDDPDNVALAEKTVKRISSLSRSGEGIDEVKLRYIIDLERNGEGERIEELLDDVVAVTSRGRKIRARTVGQAEYVRSIRRNTLTIAAGPAGTGKTYLAMALAVMALKNRTCERIILTRPAVEAGEKLGFLPGDMTQKVDPYLRPLYDALFEMMGTDNYMHLVEKGVLEIAPLAFMRGRTLGRAFIILDEAQNTTTEQMKMFLTRIGENSKCVVTGDPSQVDLGKGRVSGLTHAIGILDGIRDIGIVRLQKRDVVRHELVQRIVEAYERNEEKDDTRYESE